MTAVIQNVPQSGVYYSQGAIVQLVVQLLDLNTLTPIQLQTASGFTITLQYPDFSVQEFAANLWTDGSDGMIVYTTQPGDLDQSGLYQMQGTAVVNGVQLPMSNTDGPDCDFYCLPNIKPVSVFDGFLASTNMGVIFGVTVLAPNGNLNTTAMPPDLSGYYQNFPLILQDINGFSWEVIALAPGNLETIPYLGIPGTPQTYLYLTDNAGKNWKLTVLPTGALKTA